MARLMDVIFHCCYDNAAAFMRSITVEIAIGDLARLRAWPVFGRVDTYSNAHRRGGELNFSSPPPAPIRRLLRFIFPSILAMPMMLYAGPPLQAGWPISAPDGYCGARAD